jgi:hypothetical protein
MSYHQREAQVVLLGEGQILCRTLPKYVPIESNQARGTSALQDAVRERWVFVCFAERFGSLDEQTCLLDRSIAV